MLDGGNRSLTTMWPQQSLISRCLSPISVNFQPGAAIKPPLDAAWLLIRLFVCQGRSSSIVKRCRGQWSYQSLLILIHNTRLLLQWWWKPWAICVSATERKETWKELLDAASSCTTYEKWRHIHSNAVCSLGRQWCLYSTAMSVCRQHLPHYDKWKQITLLPLSEFIFLQQRREKQQLSWRLRS